MQVNKTYKKMETFVFIVREEGVADQAAETLIQT